MKSSTYHYNLTLPYYGETDPRYTDYTGMLEWLLCSPAEVNSRDGKVAFRRQHVLLDLTPGAVAGVPYEDQYYAGLTEAAQIVSGVQDVDRALDQIQRFAPNIRKYTDGYGLYGVRLQHQILPVYRELSARPWSRRAVMTPNSAANDLLLGLGFKDHPCTTSLAFSHTGEALDMFVTMRSTDAWLGLPMDMIMFSVVQATLAKSLEVKPGSFRLATADLHLYERNLDRVREYMARDVDPTNPWDTVVKVSDMTRSGALLALDGLVAEQATESERVLAQAVADHLVAGDL